MDDGRSYLDKLYDDLIEQFRDKPNIQMFQKALARQLNELHAFFIELNTLRWLKTAEGVQLDGIGDIVVMSRADAVRISTLAGHNIPMDDENYRLYLAWKIHLNTSESTYRDVYNSLKMFWDESPLMYYEDIAHPATIFFKTPPLPPEANAHALFLAPKVKAAGVALHVLATTETELDPVTIRIGGVVFRGVMITRLPQYLLPVDYDQEIHLRSIRQSITQTKLMPYTYTVPASIKNDNIGVQDGKLMLANGDIVDMVMEMGTTVEKFGGSV